MSQASGSRTDLWGGAAWVGLGCAILVESLRMDRFESMGATVYTYPGFVPGLIGAVVVVLGLLLMARGWRAQAQTSDSEPVMPARVAIALLLSLGFCLVLLSHTHFVLATALFVATFTFLFADPAQPRMRRLVVASLSGAITAMVVFYVFQEIFLVRLP